MATRKNAGITGSGGANVDPLYNQSFPPSSSKNWKPTIPEPDLRPGGKYNPIKPKNKLDPMFNRPSK
jgi:hypothetical protein